MSSLWSAAATREGIFAKGFSTAVKKRPRQETEVKVEETSTAKLFRVRPKDNYMQSLNAMKSHIIDLLNISDSEFNLDDFGGA